jgi:hypothetical protein
VRNFSVGLLAAVLGATLLVQPGFAKKPEVPVDPGPQPDFLAAQQLSETTIRASFFDPNSAEFQWPFAWTGSYYKPMLQSKKVGWWTCGLVNARNRMGGYVGFQNFVVVFNNGSLIFTEVGSNQQFDLTKMGCAKAVQQGALSRADQLKLTAQAVDPAKPMLGISFGPAPDGLYIMSVDTGYPAALAGIQPGMVISQINGITLKGMQPSAAGQIMAATGSEVTLTIIGRGDVRLVKATATVGGN